MRAVILFFLGILFLHSAYGQSESNPFDLKYRPANPKQKITIPPARPIIKDTFAKIETPPPVVREVEPDTASYKPDSTAGSSDNPFNLRDEIPEDSISGTPAIEEKTQTPLVQPIQTLKKPSKGIQTFFLLLSLLFLIFVVNVERSFVRDLWRVISNENYSSLHHRNQRNTMRQILLMMGYLVFIIQAGIFLYHLLYWFGYNGTILDNVWACIALVLGVYLIRHGVIRYLRWLFNNDKEMTLFSFDISIFNIMVGLVLLPLNVLLNFGPESMAKPLIIIGIVAFCLAYLMRQLRWMLTARQLIANSLLLFFVYLCAVEILPLWAISSFFW